MAIADNLFQDAQKVTEDPWNPPQVVDEPPKDPPPSTRNSIPWERERSFTTLKDTLLDVVLEPGATFRAAHPDVSLLPALSFALILGCLAYGLNLGMQAVLRYFGGDIVLGPSILPGWTMVFFPFRLAFQTFFNAGLLHLALMVTGANTLRFGASFRISAYAIGATALFGAVPVVGHWVSLLVLFLVEVAAIRSMHKTTDGKAAFAAIAPVLLRWAFFLGLALIGGYSVASLFD